MQRFSFFLLTLLLLVCSKGHAQNITVETSFTGSLVVCQSPITFSVAVQNTSVSATLTNVVVNPHMNSGMKYVAGSLGSSSGLVTLSSANAGNNPDFSVGTLLPGQSDTITFQAIANCTLLSSLGQLDPEVSTAVKNMTDVKYKISSTNYTEYEPNEANPIGSPSYNVLYPDIEIIMESADASQSGKIGDQKIRRLKIRNNGYGKLDTVSFKVLYQQSALQNVHVKVNGTSQTAASTTSNSKTYLLTDFTVASGSISGNAGNGDAYLDHNEYFYVEEKVELTGCSQNTQTDYTVAWGCDAAVCNENKNNAQASGYISIPVGHPTIGWDMLSQITFCKTGQDLVYQVSNSASGTDDKAFNFTFTLSTSGTYGSFVGYKIWNGTSNSYVTLPSGAYVSYGPSSINYTFQMTSDVDGAGGLDDLDGDGYYDDLPPGSSIKLATVFDGGCPSDFSSCNRSVAYYMYSYASYTDNCGTYVPLDAWVQKLIWNYTSHSIKGPTDLSDGQTGVYTFNVSYSIASERSPLKCGALHSDFISVIELPLGYTYTAPKVTWIEGDDTLLFNYTMSGQTMTITGGNLAGRYILPLTLDCDGESSESISDELTWTMKVRCDNSCTSCEMLLACRTLTVYNHCIDCDGFATTSMSVDRTSMGWPAPAGGQIYKESDFTSGAVTRLNYSTLADKSKYRLNGAYEYDTLRAVITGELNNKTYNNAHVEVYYTLPFTPRYDMQAPLEVLSAVFTINTVTCSTAVTPTISLSGSKYTYDFTVPSGCHASFVSGDKVDLTINFRVRGRNAAFYNNFGGIAYGQNELSDFRANHYGFNTSSEKESCQSFGDDMTLLVLYAQHSSAWQSTTTNHIIGMPESLHLYYGEEDNFPNEFRPYVKIREVSYVMPDKFRFSVAGPNIMGYNELYYGIGQVWPADFVKTPVSSPVLSAGKKYTWTRGPEWPVFTKAPYNYVEFFQFFLTGDCDAPAVLPQTTAYMKYSMFDYTGNPAYIQLSSNLSVGHNVTTDDFSNANLSISSEGIQEGVSAVISWPVTVCNNAIHSRPQVATNAWLAVEPRVSNIEILGVSDEEGNALPANSYMNTGSVIENKMVYLPNVELNTCYTYHVNARYTGCVSDVLHGIDVYSNWAYEGLPTKREGAYCRNPIQKDTLFIRYKTANLQDTISKLGPELEQICDTVTYQINLLSSQYADMNRLKLEVDLPEHVTYTTGNLWRALGSGDYETWNESLCAPGTSPLSFDLSCDEEILGKQADNPDGFDQTALVGSRHSDHSTLYLKLKLHLGCGYDPADLVKFHIQGFTNCNDQIDLYSQQRIRIQGLDPLDRMALNITSTDFDQLREATATIVLTNTGTETLGTNVPEAERFVEVTLPTGTSMLTSTLTPPAVVTSTPVSGGTRYSWPLPALAVQQTITYTFKYKNNGANPNPADTCTPYNLTLNARTVMRNNLTCSSSGGNCNASGTTAFGYTTIRVYDDAECDTTYCLNSFAPYNNKQYVLSVWVKETAGSTPVTSYTHTSASLYFEGTELSMGPFYPKGEIIDGWQHIDTVFTIPSSANSIEVRLNNTLDQPVYFDDVRIHPFNSNMKSYVYDPVSLRLWAELDENNYATLYEYDEEGGLVRVKKETERGVMTIRESRTNVSKKKY